MFRIALYMLSTVFVIVLMRHSKVYCCFILFQTIENILATKINCYWPLSKERHTPRSKTHIESLGQLETILYIQLIS